MKIFQERVAHCQEGMIARGYRLLILFPGPNMYYLSGFAEPPSERPLFLVLPDRGEPLFILPELYRDQVERESWIAELRSWRDGDDPWRLVAQTLREFRKDHAPLLLDDRLWARFTLPLLELLKPSKVGLASEVLAPLRMRKSEEEISYLREAAAIADRALPEVLRRGIVGLKEQELARSLEYEMERLGAEGVAFETLVASGPNGALPHHRAGGRGIEEGDVVVLDYGCRLRGYHSDTTRTVVCGPPSPHVEEVYGVVQEAQERAVQAVEPGMAAEEIDRVARAEIERAGFGEYFTHRTGHGIGLEVHEAPFIVEGNRQVLEPGMAFSIEPGIYILGEFGIRIEDIVLVTGDSVERLNLNNRELQAVN